MAERRRRDPAERFWEKVDKTENCWLWTAGLSPAGYGRFNLEGRNWLAHHVALLFVRGMEIPAGRQVDHVCRVRRCVNPDHLELVTHAENMRRKPPEMRRRAGSGPWTHCKQGHEMTPDNVLTNARGARMCRECNRVRSAAYKRRMREGELH